MTNQAPAYDIDHHSIVSNADWTTARKALLVQEKEFTRARDRLAQARRDLPWERVDKAYSFDGPSGKRALSELFGASSQLVVYHFMFTGDPADPNWGLEGCKSCSFWADTFNGCSLHLPARDISFVAISRAPRTLIEPYQRRMGWTFTWLSSFGSDFNHDFGVTFTQAEVDGGRSYYNYGTLTFPHTEAPGVSVFLKDRNGAIFHTYSAYGRGIDILNGAYSYIDLVPKGRDEGDTPQSWVRRHDEYGG